MPVAVPGGVEASSVANWRGADGCVGRGGGLPDYAVAESGDSSQTTETANRGSAESVESADGVVPAEGVAPEGVGERPEAGLRHELEEVEELELIELAISVAVNLHQGLVGLSVGDVARHSTEHEQLVEEHVELGEVEGSSPVEIVPGEDLVDVLSEHHVADVHGCLL